MNQDQRSQSWIPIKTWEHFWHPVCTLHEFRCAKPAGRGPLKVRLLGRDLAIVEIDSEVVALRDRCCHRSASLSCGNSEPDGLRCKYHGWKYGGTGKCIDIPSNPHGPIPKQAAVPAFDCCVRYGLVWVRINSELAVTEIPAHPAWDDSRYKCVMGEPYTWQTSASRRVENFIDLAHFPFIHPNTLGDPDKPEVPSVDIARKNGEMRFSFDMPKPERRLETSWIGDIDYRLPMPFTVNLDLRNSTLADAGDSMLWMTACPVDEGVSRSYYFICRTGAHDAPDEPHTSFQEIVLAEDIDIVESQCPSEIPLFGHDYNELSVPADALSIHYRRWLKELSRVIDNGDREIFRACLYAEGTLLNASGQKSVSTGAQIGRSLPQDR